MTPSWLMMPARYISAMISMMPEPHTPVTPVAAVAAANPGSSDHRSEPITLKRGSSVSRSMRTRSIAPGAARWPQLICAPSKAGPGRAGAGDEALAVAKHDFGVGADVDEQRHLVPEIRPLRQHHAGRIRADVAGDARQHVDARVAVQLQVDDVARSVERMIGRERERRAAELHRIDAEQQVVHDRIADQRRLEDVLVRYAGACAPRRPRALHSASRTAAVICAAPPGFIIE